MKETVGSNE